MVRKKVVDYIRGLLQRGYDISSIRGVMLKYGYSENDINEAMEKIYHPTIRHEIHLSKTTIFVILAVVVSLAGTAFFFFYSGQEKTPKQLLDLKLEPLTTEAEAGSDFVFIKQMSNLGSSKRYDVVITEEIIDAISGKRITQNTETIAIETSSSTQTRLLIPKDAKPGDYLLRVNADYGGKKAFAKAQLKIVAAAGKEPCFDGVKNHGEEGIDCGGVCKPCEEAVCNDNNPCTNDKIENGKCVNEAIVPCCGNRICEANEICASDCEEETRPVTTETLDSIKDTAKTNPSKALQQCNQIDVPDLKDACIRNIGEVRLDKSYCLQIENAEIKDRCYSNIASAANDSTICQYVSLEGIRDSCYSNFFVPPNKDYTVCDKITNKDLRLSCDRLRQFHEIIQTVGQEQQT